MAKIRLTQPQKQAVAELYFNKRYGAVITYDSILDGYWIYIGKRRAPRHIDYATATSLIDKAVLVLKSTNQDNTRFYYKLDPKLEITR